MAEINNTNTIGYTAETLKNLLLDAGAIYLDYGVADKERLLGCCSGASEFDVKPTYRKISANGLSSTTRGLNLKIDEEVTLKVQLLEVTTDILELALNAAVDSTGLTNDVITASESGGLNYLTNVALVTRISGSQEPIIIILKNAVNLDGLSMKVEDNKDNLLPITFTASLDPLNPKVSPYEIRFPKIV